MAENDPRSVAVDIQTKFQFYVLGLTFGVLALSVQTASFGGQPVVARIAELLAWLFLLASGLFGLSRIEWTPHAYLVDSVSQEVEARKRSLEKAQLQGASSIRVLAEGRDRPVEELLARADEDMKVVNDRRAYLDKRSQFKYTAQKVGFVGGLAAVMIARGLRPLLEIIAALR